MNSTREDEPDENADTKTRQSWNHYGKMMTRLINPFDKVINIVNEGLTWEMESDSESSESESEDSQSNSSHDIDNKSITGSGSMVQ